MANEAAWTGTPANVGNITLYAQWTAKKVNIYFDSDGGSDVASMKLDYDETVTAPLPTPTKTGYTFKGWRVKTDANTYYTVNSESYKCNQPEIKFEGDEGSLTLYAEWEAETYNITYEYHGNVDNLSDAPSNPKVTYDAEFSETVLWTPHRPGYDFKGWWLTYNTTTGVYSDSVSTSTPCKTTSVTLHAKWEARPYTITLNANATGAYFDNVTTKTSKEVTITYDSAYRTINDWNDRCGLAQSNSELAFAGWYVDQAYTSQRQGDDIFTEDDTTAAANLYARWAGSCKVYAHGGTLPDDCCAAISAAAANANEDYDYSFAVFTGQPVNTNLSSCTDCGLNSITRTGYQFAGWYWDAAYTQEADLNANYTSGSLHAKWDTLDYQVNFNANPISGGVTTGSVTPTSAKIKYDTRYGRVFTVSGTDTTYIGLPDPTRTGYNFLHWYADFSNGTYSQMVTDATEYHPAVPGEHTLYAEWEPVTYTITFNPNGDNISKAGFDGNEDNAVKTAQVDFAKEHSTATASTGTWTSHYGVSRTGYDFEDWYTAADNSGHKVTGDSIYCIPNDRTLYAHWTAHQHTCTLDVNGGTLNAGSSCSGIASNNTFTVTYDQPINTVLTNCNYNSTTAMTRTGYTFVGWFTKNGATNGGDWGVEANFLANYHKDGDTTFYARWNANDYPIFFHANGSDDSPAYFDSRNTANDPKTATVYYDNKYNSALATSGVTTWDGHYGVFRPGYTFAGWFTEGGVEYTGTEDYITVGNTDLYAHWTANNYYTLKLNANGYGSYNGKFGNSATKTLTGLTYDTRYDVIGNANGGWPTFGATLTGHTLTGWKDGSGNARTANDLFTGDDTLSNSFVLYAQWAPNTYNVTFDVNIPTNASTTTGTPEGKTVTYGSTYGTLPTPTLTGYTFGGWYRETSFTTEVKESTVYEPSSNPGDHTLYAKWTAKNVIVTFNGNGGTPSTQQETYTFDQQYGSLPTVTKTGYHYVWKDGSTTVDGNSVCNSTNIVWPAGTLELTAEWTGNTYTVTFDLNKPSDAPSSGTSTVPGSQSVIYGQTYGTLTDATLTGYTFGGWYRTPADAETGTDRVLSTTIYAPATNPGNHKLYAKWTPISYYCHLNLMGGSLPAACATTSCSVMQSEGTGLYKFPVTYSKPMNQSITSSCSDPECNLNGVTRLGYAFKGWYWNSECTSALWNQNLANQWQNAGDLTLYAKWDVKNVKVTLNPGGGTFANNPNSVHFYELPYWFEKVEGRDEYIWIIDWIHVEDDSYINRSTVVNVYGELYNTESTDYDYGIRTYRYINYYTDTIKRLDNHPLQPRTGYIFRGWYPVATVTQSSDTAGKRVLNSTPLFKDEDHEIYAQWQARKVDVTFSANTPGPTSVTLPTPNPMEVTYDQLCGDLSEPTCTGYTFQGWYTAATGGTMVEPDKKWNKSDFSTMSVPSGNSEGKCSLTLFAHWSKDPVTVYFDPQGGKLSPENASKQVDFNALYGTLPNPSETVPEDSVFRGWFLTSACTGNEINENSYCNQTEYIEWNNHVGSITLYAKWEHKITATLKQDSVSCNGYHDGGIKVTITNRGAGAYLEAKFTKGTITYTKPIASSISEFTFTGTDDEPITAGEWTVTIYDTITKHTGPFAQEACKFTNKVMVEEPAQLSYTATPTPQTCSMNGKITVTVTNNSGTPPYHVWWKGSTGFQQGDRPFATSQTVISNLNPQSFNIKVSDKNGCRIGDTSLVYDNVEVVVNPASNALNQAVYNSPVAITACSGNEFAHKPASPDDGTNIPTNAFYSWEAPTSTGSVDGNMDPTIHGLINTVGTYTYTVTPSLGLYCPGEPFDAVVTVNPNDGPAITLTSPDVLEVSGCAGSTHSLEVTLSSAVNEVVCLFEGETLNMNHISGNTYKTTNFKLPTPTEGCTGSYSFIVKATNASACAVSFTGTANVTVPDEWESFPNDDTHNGTFACIENVPVPTNIPTAKDGCGRIVTSDSVRITYKAEDGTEFTTTKFPCKGQVRYTYYYFACNGDEKEWHYTYNVIGDYNESASPLSFSTPPAGQADATPAGANCMYIMPDLTDTVMSKVTVAAGSCSGIEDLTVTQATAAGTYINQTQDVEVTITDKCGNKLKHTVNVKVLDSPQVTANVDALVACNHGTTSATATVDSTTGTLPYTYKWNTSPVQDSVTAVDLTARSYTVTVTDGNGCRGYAYVNVVEPVPVSFTLAADREEFCAGDSTVLRANNVYGGNGGFTYYWTKNGSAMDLNAAITPMQVLTDTTIYTLYIKDVKGCQADVQTKTVAVNPRPVVTVSPKTTTLCSGETDTLKATVAGLPEGRSYQLTWDGIYNVEKYPVSTNGIHTVTAMDNLTFCSASDTATVTVNSPAVTLNEITGDTTVCYKGNTTLTVTPRNYTDDNDELIYKWFKNNDETTPVGTGATLNLTELTANAKYTAMVIAQVGDCSDTAKKSVNVTVLHPTVGKPVITGTTTICTDGNTTLTVSAEKHDAATVSYTWTPATGLNTTTGETVVVSNLTNTTEYTVVAKADTTLNGVTCSATDTAKVTVNVLQPAVTLKNIADTVICNGGTATLKAVLDGTATGNVTCLWTSNSTETITNPRNPQIAVSPTETTTYTVVATATADGAQNCQTTANKTVTVTVNSPEVTLNDITGDTTVCYGGGTTLTVTPNNYVGTLFPYQWTSSAGGETLGTSNVLTLSNLTATATYTVVATVKKGGCEKTASKSVKVTVLNPTVTVPTFSGETNICPGGSTTLTVSATKENADTVTYAWSPFTGLNTNTDTTVTATLSATQQYTVKATASKTLNGKTCTFAKEGSVTVTVLQPAVALKNMTDTTICNGGTAKLKAVLDGTPTSNVTYVWSSNNSNETINGQSITVTPTTTTTYTVTATVTAESGEVSCPATATKSVTVTVNSPAVTLSDIEGDSVVCYKGGTTLSVTPSNYTGTLTYAWSDGTNTLGSTTNVLTLTNLTADATYSVTATATVGTCPMPATKLMKVRVLHPTVALETMQPVTICMGDTATLKAVVIASETNGAVTYEWNTGATVDSIRSFAGGNYRVTATATMTSADADGSVSCTATATKTVSVTVNNPHVELNNITGNTTVCYSGNTTLMVTTSNYSGSILTYEWKKGDTPIENAFLQMLSLNGLQEFATYTVIATATEGSCTDTAMRSVDVTVLHPSLENLSLTPNTTICAGVDSATLTISATLHDADTVTYLWNPILGLDVNTVATVKASPASTKTYPNFHSYQGALPLLVGIGVSVGRPL